LSARRFYIPFAEDFLFTEVFQQIHSSAVNAGPRSVESIVSISISTDKTVVWWDHWEDGYDLDVVAGTAPSTEIWGDGNADNGCAPDVKVCTHNNDYLLAGRSIVIQNTVALPRMAEVRRYDGGDRIQSSLPVAITRSAFPASPGSEMAGAGAFLLSGDMLLSSCELCPNDFVSRRNPCVFQSRSGIRSFGVPSTRHQSE
jgi:hypothetical protein